MEIEVLASSSSGNCYVISDTKTNIIIECGLQWDCVLEHFNYSVLKNVAGVLITHEHTDHARYIQKAIDTGLDIYASQGTFEALGLEKDYRLHIVKDKQFEVSSFIIRPFKVEHDAKEPLGFLIYSKVTREKLLFVTDSYYIHWQFPPMDYLMIECNYQIEHLRRNVDNGSLNPQQIPRLTQSHMSLDTCVAFLKHQNLSKVKRIYLLHLSDGNSNAEECRNTVMQETGIPTIIAEKRKRNGN